MPIARAQAPGAFAARIRRGIGLRLLVRVVLFSSAVTLVLTLFQLYLDYSHDVGVIERRLDEIEQGYLNTIAENLRHRDRAQEDAGAPDFPNFGSGRSWKSPAPILWL
jgi:hypothetical protein